MCSGGYLKETHVNLPSDFWYNTKFCLQEPVTQRRLIDHTDVMTGCFVVHTPSSVHKRQLTVPDQRFYLLFD
jgi:hypothetical protein